MNTTWFFTALLVVSILTSLTVEAIKKIFNELHKTYHSNVLAGVVSVVLSIAVYVGYQVVINGTITSTNAVYLMALMFLSWLCAMLGYDKVIQTLSQINESN